MKNRIARSKIMVQFSKNNFHSHASRQETIEQLLSNMLDGEQSESVIVNGIQVLLTLLEPRRPRYVINEGYENKIFVTFRGVI